MKTWKNWLMGKLTVNDLVEYFYSIGIELDLTFQKKRAPIYCARNSRLYKRTFKEDQK